MSAYALIDVHIHDIGRYMQFMRAMRPLISDAGGRYLVRGGEAHVHQGEYAPGSLVVIEFPSMASLDGLYASAAYRALADQYRDCAEARVIAVEGLTH